MPAVARHVPSPAILARRIIKVEVVVVRRHFFIWIIVGWVVFGCSRRGSAEVYGLGMKRAKEGKESHTIRIGILTIPLLLIIFNKVLPVLLVLGRDDNDTHSSLRVGDILLLLFGLKFGERILQHLSL